MNKDFLHPAMTVMKDGHPCTVDAFDHDKVVDASLLLDMRRRKTSRCLTMN